MALRAVRKVFLNPIEKIQARIQAFTCLIFFLDYFMSTPPLPIHSKFHLEVFT